MLDRWLQIAIQEAGAEGADPTLGTQDTVTLLLNLARDAAHGVARPAAPLATFAAGLALGRNGGGLDELAAAVDRLVAAANEWARSEDAGGTDQAPDGGAAA
ncbi:MAG: DUF6457 domain-containing protein [Acidimicrobiia bacterium]